VFITSEGETNDNIRIASLPLVGRLVGVWLVSNCSPETRGKLPEGAGGKHAKKPGTRKADGCTIVAGPTTRGANRRVEKRKTRRKMRKKEEALAKETNDRNAPATAGGAAKSEREKPPQKDMGMCFVRTQNIHS